MEELFQLTKQSLSIISTATLKDDEIEMWINAGIADLLRCDIDANNNLKNALIQSTIVMFVKANFGNVDIKEKELAQRTYSLLCNNLSLSSDFKVADDDA